MMRFRKSVWSLMLCLFVYCYCLPPIQVYANLTLPDDYEVIVLYGQSNCVGEGQNLQIYTGNGLDQELGNDYNYKSVADPVDSDVGQIDTISSDPEANGSVWPIMCNRIDAVSNGKRLLLVPCPLGGQSITNLMPVGDTPQDITNRATLFGSAMWRALLAAKHGHLLCWNYWQGETDALNGMSQAEWAQHMTDMADCIWTNAHCPVVLAQLQVCRGVTAANQAAISNAIVSVIGTHHIIAGPNLSKYVSDDNFHLIIDNKIQPAGNDWGDALLAAFPAELVFGHRNSRFRVEQHILKGPDLAIYDGEDMNHLTFYRQ